MMVVMPALLAWDKEKTVKESNETCNKTTYPSLMNVVLSVIEEITTEMAPL